MSKLSGEEQNTLTKIIKYPRALHHKLDSKTFCTLIQKLAVFQLVPTTDGYKLLLDNKPVDSFHREHDKPMDGNFLQKFANIFTDLQIDLSHIKEKLQILPQSLSL